MPERLKPSQEKSPSTKILREMLGKKNIQKEAAKVTLWENGRGVMYPLTSNRHWSETIIFGHDEQEGFKCVIMEASSDSDQVEESAPTVNDMVVLHELTRIAFPGSLWAGLLSIEIKERARKEALELLRTTHQMAIKDDNLGMASMLQHAVELGELVEELTPHLTSG